MISMRPSDFEDRGLHQQSKHFRVYFSKRAAAVVATAYCTLLLY